MAARNARETSAATRDPIARAAIDLSKIRAGDVLLVRCIAAHGFSHQRPMVTPAGGGLFGNDFMPPTSAIVSHDPRGTLRVGDRVCIPPIRAEGTILALAGDSAWVDWTGRAQPTTVLAQYLERAACSLGGSGSTSAPHSSNALPGEE